MLSKLKDLEVVTCLLVAVNILVFIICTVVGDSVYDIGELSRYAIVYNGEYARLITSMFLHGDFMHIFNNMILLFFLGGIIEKELGHLLFGLVYFVSGIGGNVASLIYKIISGSFATSIGASGAVFGLDGVLLAMILFSEKRIENITPNRMLLAIAYSLYSGFVGANIDNAAHVGGLVVGFLLGTIISLVKYRK